MEALFFKNLLTFLRDHDVHAFYSLPLKADFPAVTLDHRETRILLEASVIDFTLTLMMNTIDQSQMMHFNQKIHALLNDYARINMIAIHIRRNTQKPHETGKLRTCTLDCSMRIGRSRAE